MNSDSAVYVGIAMVLIAQGVALWRRQKKLKEQMKDIEKKTIEWYGPDVVLKTKNYPDQELRDDFREEVGDVKESKKDID